MNRVQKPWFPSSPDRDHLEAVLLVLGGAMGFVAVEGIVADYLDGKSILSRVGRHGVRHFDTMTLTLGMKPPEVSS